MTRQGLMSGLRIVSICTLVSRVLGLVRDTLMARLFGNGPFMDAFSVAFRIPNLARAMFGEGALTTAFLPAAVQALDQGGKPAAWKLATALFRMLALFLTGIVLIGELTLALLWPIYEGRSEIQLLIGLTAVMLPYLIFICLAAQAGALLQSLGRFAWPALVPVILNLVWMGAMLAIVPHFESDVARIYVVAAAVLLAGLLQLVAPFAGLLWEGYQPARDWREALPRVKQISRSIIPVVIGLSVTQINTLSDSLIAWGFSPSVDGTANMSLPGNPLYPLEPGTAASLYYGQRLYQFPLGVFGVALGTVMFPLFARHAGRGRFEELRDDVRIGLTLVLAIGLPASVGLMLLANPITTLIFRYGAFDAKAVLMTSSIIAAYGSGVWAYCGISIINRVYYALEDRATPLRIGILMLVLNLLLTMALIWPFRGTGIAFATSLCAMIQVALSIWLVQRKIGSLPWKGLADSTWRIAAATLFMAIVILTINRGLATSNPEDSAAALSLTVRGRNLVLPLVAGLLSYLLTARILRIHELGMIFSRDKRIPSE